MLRIHFENYFCLYWYFDSKEGKYQGWLEAELQRRFDFVCAESMQSFRNADYAITREGQTKRGKSNHEKDDRFSINDRTRWVTGFSNNAKLFLFETKAKELANTVKNLSEEIEKLTEKERGRAQRAMYCQTLVNLQWEEIDVETLVKRIDKIQQDLNASRKSNNSLQKAEKRLKEEQALLEVADKKLRDIEVKVISNRDSSSELTRKKTETQQQLEDTPLSPEQKTGLDLRFEAMGAKATLDNVGELIGQLTEDLTKEIEKLARENAMLGSAIEKSFSEFKHNWKSESADLDTTIASAPDFFAKLNRLELDGLPAHEERFFDLLRNQSHQNLAALSTYLSQARKEIADRLELVNQGLSEAPFNTGTTLHIQFTDRQLPEVREFKQEIQLALSHAWTDDRESAEARFLILREMVKKLGSDEGVDRRWRETVLDVRQHVDFIGRELDHQGVEVEVYRSGSGKSGGQRQKLATTCLAAALRYQLGGHERGFPSYAPVILDEAFDKADNEFTALAMNIFTNFGFQMIVATPLKSVMTLEPFIGGACVVAIKNRNDSKVLLIEYDTEKARLRLPDTTPAMAGELR